MSWKTRVKCKPRLLTKRYWAMQAGALVLLASMSSNVMACFGQFYVVFMDADASSQIRIRESLINFSGVNDRYATVTLPDSALGGSNYLYMNALLNEAFVHNTKLLIATDDTDCEIDNQGEDLGTITDVQSADFS